MTLSSSLAFAQKGENQALPDFTGTWILDNEESSFSDPNDKENYREFTLVISQNELDIKIIGSYLFQKTRSEYKTTLFTDKRGEENHYPVKVCGITLETSNLCWLIEVTMKSKTFWKKDTIVREGSLTVDKGVLSPATTVKETYILSKDSKTMTIISLDKETRFNSSGPHITTTYTESKFAFHKKGS